MAKNFARIGWRARIALIKPAAGYADISCFHRIAPEGVAITATVVSKPIQLTNVEQLAGLKESVVESAKIVSVGNPDVILLNCTSGSLIKGYGYDQELINEIETATGTQAITTTTAVIAALNQLKAKNICLVTPYIQEVNEIERKFLEDTGFKVVQLQGLQIEKSNEIPNIPPYEIYQFAKKSDVPTADTMFISCTALDTLDIIEQLEYDLGKPVVTSNQAALWYALRKAKVREPIPGFGTLFREY